jgi:hypothetical protein
MRLWLVHRHGFRWAAWQDWLEVPDGLDGPDVVHLVAAARDAVNAWLGIEDPENRRSL